MPDKETFQDWVANTPVPKQGGKPGETQALKWAVAQARQRATNAQDAARDAVSALGDVAKLIGDSTLTEEARAAFAADIAHRTAKTVERLDASAVAEQLEITVKEKP